MCRFRFRFFFFDKIYVFKSRLHNTFFWPQQLYNVEHLYRDVLKSRNKIFCKCRFNERFRIPTKERFLQVK